MSVSVKFKKLDPRATLPTRATPFAAGLDLYALEDRHVVPGHPVLVSTGLAIELPPGYEGQVRPRSGLACKEGITVINSPGTIDEDYRGELKVGLVNIVSNYTYFLKAGDRIAQLVVAPVVYPVAEEVQELSPAPTRGDSGFGSTGV
jgi:dUTP pyrophosphatase